MKKWRLPLVARKAGLRLCKRSRHCCCRIVGPPAKWRGKTTTTLASASRQSVVTNGLCSIMCGMKPAAAYLLAQLLLPRLPHCLGASQSALQSAGSAQASSR